MPGGNLRGRTRGVHAHRTVTSVTPATVGSGLPNPLPRESRRCRWTVAKERIAKLIPVTTRRSQHVDREPEVAEKVKESCWRGREHGGESTLAQRQPSARGQAHDDLVVRSPPLRIDNQPSQFHGRRWVRNSQFEGSLDGENQLLVGEYESARRDRSVAFPTDDVHGPLVGLVTLLPLGELARKCEVPFDNGGVTDAVPGTPIAVVGSFLEPQRRQRIQQVRGKGVPRREEAA